ncbi:hypothetical protein L218DRAFT_351545 [Marasmius fiardii PR-910]|nr:hypothetical protein L218DRAFT_351545 [Marasmius fiardii PR-910]
MILLARVRFPRFVPSTVLSPPYQKTLYQSLSAGTVSNTPPRKDLTQSGVRCTCVWTLVTTVAHRLQMIMHADRIDGIRYRSYRQIRYASGIVEPRWSIEGTCWEIGG